MKKCKNCGMKFKNNSALSRHINKCYGSTEDYYDKFIKDENEETICPYCKKNKRRFKRLTEGYFIPCEECKNKHRTVNKEYWMVNFGKTEKEAKIILSENSRHDTDFYVEKYGKVEGIKFQNDLIKRASDGAKKTFATKDKLFFLEKSWTSKEFWLKRGFSLKESELKAEKAINHVRKNNWSKRKANTDWRKFHNSQLEYWIKKSNGDLEKAKKMFAERQATFSRKKCIQKYGEKEGLKRFKKRQDKWLSNLPKAYSSKQSNDFFKIIKEILGGGQYAADGGELFLHNDEKNAFYDFTYKNLIVEYNGDIWHANPEIFQSTDQPNPFNDNTAQDIWNNDQRKKDLAEEYGYKLLTVWENRVKIDFKSEVQIVLDWIKNEVR